MSSIDAKAVADLIAKDRHKLLDQIEAALVTRLRAISPRDALGFRLMLANQEIRKVPAAATTEYASIVIAFMRGKAYEGYDVDSCVTPIALECVESEIIKFYTSSEISSDIVEEIVRQVGGHATPSTVISEEISEQINWLRREATTAASDTASSVASQVLDVTIEQIQLFLASSTGKAIVAAITKAAATSAGKVALQKLLLAAVQKILASTAMKSAIMSIIKKIGISLIIKTAVGKVMLALLAAVGIAKIPVLWIILPLIAAFLVYEYNNFPEKLSRKLPVQIRSSINERFDDMNSQIVAGIIKGILGMLEKQIFETSST